MYVTMTPGGGMYGLEVAQVVAAGHFDQPVDLLGIGGRTARNPRLKPRLDLVPDGDVTLGPLVPGWVKDDRPGHRRSARARSI